MDTRKYKIALCAFLSGLLLVTMPLLGSVRLVRVGVVKGKLIEAPYIISTVGAISSRKATYVQSLVAGKILSVAVHNGQIVKDQQALVYIDPVMLKHDQDIVLAELNKVNILLQNQQELVRKTSILVRHKAQTGTVLTSEVAKLKVLEMDERAVKARLRKVKFALKHTTIRAPFSGQIHNVKIAMGSVVSAGTPVILLVDTKALKAILPFPQHNRSLIKSGMVVRLYKIDGSKVVVNTKIHHILPIVNDKTLSFTAVANLVNTGDWYPGDATRAEVVVKSARKVILIPAACIVFRKNTSFVYVVEKPSKQAGFVKRTAVHLSGMRGDNVEVIAGLSPGQLVVNEGNMHIIDGQKVGFVRDQSEGY